MPRARLKFKPPGGERFGLLAFTAEHPDDEFRILRAIHAPDGLLVVLEATMDDPEALLDLFERAPLDFSHEVLHADGETVLVQYRLPVIPPPYRALVASGNLPQFPMTVRGGWFLLNLTTSHDRLARFRDELAETGFTIEVVSVAQSLDPTALLTDRQRRFVAEAIRRGYYDTPRACSLTDLAAALGVSKSTASVVLHGAEEVMIKEFFAEPT